MNILVIGAGGREHALCWKLSQSPHTSALYCAPGNAGIAQIANCLPAQVHDPAILVALAESIKADLTFIGPELPLVAGAVDAFNERGLPVVGPARAAARLEGSKIFSKQFMSRHSIPTARFTVCDSVESAQKCFASEFQFPVVVKADGLAAGKGVLIPHDEMSFNATLNAMMVDRLFGEAGDRIVIEECLTGREASVMIFSDGRDYQLIVPAQDYKRAGDGDQGFNTGGMGSFSTPGLIDDRLLARIRREIIEPSLEGMATDGNPFRGILYAGLMLTDDGPRVLEYNVRLGDPETQSVLMRLDSDLVEIGERIIDGSIGAMQIDWSADSSVCVVVASGGYPGEFEKGKIITGLDEAGEVEGAVVFHAGTMRDEQGSFLT
ncbi:MAG TPA: phosphoribosylamine--glycine ligase, partial [Blastocatellia bacterium]